MNMETIYDDVLAEVKKLDETEKGRKRREFLTEYDELSDKLQKEHAEISSLRKEGDFNKAAEKYLSIAPLEAKERLMHPVYDEYCSTPAYDMADLIDISKDLSSVLEQKLKELESEQVELLEKVWALQQKKVFYSNDAERCNNELMRLAGVTDIRDKFKFGRIPELHLNGIKAVFRKAGFYL